MKQPIFLARRIYAKPLCLCATLLLAFWTNCPARAQTATQFMTQTDAQTATQTDALDVSDARSEGAHGYSSHGAVALETAGDWVGGHDMRRRARRVGPGGWIAYRLKVAPNAPVTLEFEEMENRAPIGKTAEVRAYSVWVNGKRAFFRTAQSSGAGPLHFFVTVPPVADAALEVRLQNETDAPFYLARAWAYSNFSSYFAKSGMAVPYFLAPTVRLTWNDFEGDLNKLRQIKSSLGDNARARAAWTTWLTYANNSDADNAARLDYILRLAQTAAMPVQISFDSWWGSTPSGSDGRGGFWSDVEYQQVVYNQTQGKYQLSIPNRWSSTPWLSPGNERLNDYKARRLQTVMAMLQERLAGREDSILALNLDNEPVYWATGNAGLGSEILLADFNPTTIAAARRDGIVLDPTDGLSFAERLWLARNLLAYNERIAAAAGTIVSPIVVDATGTRAPSEILADNIYTQAMVANPLLQYPMQSATYPFWETAAPASARVGGEWNGDSLREREAVLHQLPLGRTAQVNAESGDHADEHAGVRPGYGLGLRYYALYNYPLDKMDVAASELSDTSRGVAPHVYQRVLREERFDDDSWQERVAGTHGLQRGLIGNTTLQALYPAPGANFGWLTYRLQAPGEKFDGLHLELSGRAFVSRAKNENVRIRVLAGPTAFPTEEVARIFDQGDINAVHKIDLSDVARGQKVVFVRIELAGDRLPASVLSWSAIYQLRFTLPWPDALLQTTFAQDESLETQRQQNLLVSWRRDAELALEKLTDAPKDNPAKAAITAQITRARAAYDAGQYAQSYRAANLARSWQLPGATYRVLSSGALAPYPLRVETAAPLTLTLQSWDENGARFRVRAKDAASVSLQFGGLKSGAAYVLQREAASELWHLRPARAGDSAAQMADAGGNLKFALQVEGAEPATERMVRGTYRAILQEGVAPVFGVWRDDANGLERIILSDGATVMRGETGEPEPASLAQLQRGDAITVELDGEGKATRVTAQTRTLGGVVEQFGQLTPTAMPFVRFRGSPISHIVDLNAIITTAPQPGGAVATTPRETNLGALPIRAGDRVVARINPVTGRVFGITKFQ